MTGPRKKPETETDMVKPTEEELAAHEAEKHGDPEFIEPEAPEAVAVSDNPDEEEGVDIEDHNPDEDDPDFLGDAYYTEEEVAEAEAEPEPENWYPGQPCENCGQRGYKWTVGWGQKCSLCAPENQVEEVEEVRSGYEG